MSVLNDAFDIKLGDSQVDTVYLGSTLIWPWEAFWKFPPPTAGMILKISIDTAGDDIIVDWGDGTVESLPGTASPNQYYEHTYDGTTRYTGFRINNMTQLTRFWSQGHIAGDEPDTSTYRFGGIVDLGELVNLQSYGIRSQGADIKNFNVMTTTITNFRHNDGVISGNPSDFDIYRLPNLNAFQMNGNQLTGNVHDLSVLPNMNLYNLGNNQLSGTLPDLSNSQNLGALLLENNNLSGEIPSLATVGSVNGQFTTTITFNGNDFTSLASNFTTNPATSNILINGCSISGNLPTFDSNYSNINWLDFSGNDFSGEIPTLTNIGSNQTFPIYCWIYLNNNNLSTVASNFSLNTSLTQLDLSSNNLNTASLDKIILEVDNLGTSYSGQDLYLKKLDLRDNSGTVTGGTSNQNYINLTNRGWVVTL
jgi:hypothetical protein